MTRIVLTMCVGLVAFTSACAQDITGSWRGTTEGRDATQISLTVSKARSGALKASMVWHDNGQVVPVDRIEFANSTLTFSVLLFKSSYKGTASADGKSITGAWTEAGQTHPLKFERVAAEAPETSATPRPMGAQANPSFEVATIKPSAPGGGRRSGGLSGRRFFARNETLADLMESAYGVRARQILGVPSWAESAQYDVDAEFNGDEGTPNKEQFEQMLQKLLEDRFGLAVHRTEKEFTVYALMVGKSAPKLSPSDPGDRPRAFLRPADGGGWLLIAKSTTMADLTSFLMSQEADWQVVDRTNLTGKFDFNLTFVPEAGPADATGEKAPEASDADVGVPIFKAVEEQLGLELRSMKAPIEVIVIDHAEAPSAN